jgi:hypothetical protein
MNARVVNLEGSLVPVLGQALVEVTLGAAAALPACADATTHVFWTLDGGDMRVLWDGTNPSGTKGHEIKSGSSGVWRKEMWRRARVYGTAGTLRGTEMQE